MNKFLALSLLLFTNDVFATNVRVEVQFNENVGTVQSSQIHLAKIDGINVLGKCEVTSQNQSICSFQRSNVDTYNGLNVLLAFSELNSDTQSLLEHGTISTIIDGELYNQRHFTLDMNHKKGSVADVAGLGTLNINY